MSSGISGIGRLLRKVHAFSLAPQMDYTTAHQRFLFRLLTNHAALYTEMVTANALCHSNDPIRFLRGAERENTAEERPGRVELQLGGSDPSVMAAATKIALSHGFRHFNLNCGCPSDKVAGGGQFGVALMRKPKLVRELCEAISDASGNAVSVKCRIGIDDDDSFDLAFTSQRRRRNAMEESALLDDAKEDTAAQLKPLGSAIEGLRCAVHPRCGECGGNCA